METKYLIIGNSIAGVSCIEFIRQIDPRSEIVVLTDEEPLNYSKPLISYYLGGEIPLSKMSFRDKSFYKEHNVKILLKTRAEKLDVKGKKITTGSGEIIQFEKLLLATGGKPIEPPIEGTEAVGEKGVFNFTTLGEVQKLINYIEKYRIKEAVVLGAGLIGLKCTEGLVKRGIKVTIVELADRVLVNTFDIAASKIFEKSLGKMGCSVITKDTVTKVNGSSGKLNEVILKSGKEISTKLLVIAIGVHPNLELIKNIPVTYDKGIIVNEFMETNVKNIYAAGDVAQGRDFLTQQNSVLAIWPVAARQGKIAGFNMAGKKQKYNGSFLTNSVELAGIPSISFGITNPPETGGYEILSKRDENENFYRKIVLKDNKIVGAIFLGKIERAGIFSGLIKDKLNVSSFKKELLSDEFGLLVLPAEYRKHLVTGRGIEV